MYVASIHTFFWLKGVDPTFILLYNILAITDIYSTVNSFKVWLQWDFIMILLQLICYVITLTRSRFKQ